MASIAHLLARGVARTQVLRSSSVLLPRQINPVCQNVFTAPDRQVHVSPIKRQSADKAAGGHGTHWVMERVVAAGLYAVIPAAYIMEPSFAMDTALCAALVLHAHWGIAGIFGDYMHGYPSISGDRRYPILTTTANVLPYILSILAFACLMNFNYNDVGLVRAISMLWNV